VHAPGKYRKPAYAPVPPRGTHNVFKSIAPMMMPTSDLTLPVVICGARYKAFMGTTAQCGLYGVGRYKVLDLCAKASEGRNSKSGFCQKLLLC